MRRELLLGNFKTLSLLVAVAALAGCGGSGGGGGGGGEVPGVTTYPVTLSWDAPSTNADGTELTDLAGFVIYDGETTGVYTSMTDVGSVTTFTLELPAGTYFFSVTAYDISGNESDFSAEVSATLPLSGNLLASNP